MRAHLRYVALLLPLGWHAANCAQDSAGPATAAAVIVKAGTKIPLSLVNSLNTKRSVEGDRVYLETAFPVTQGGHIVIPKGSYVAGTVTQVKRAGTMRGKGELFLRFDSLTLPNGVTREFRSRLDSANGHDVDRQEGKLRGERDTAGDVRTVGEVAGAGSTVGAIARGGMGAGVGAIGGAVAGLAIILRARGPEVILPKGTTLEMVLDRELRYDPRELVAR
jgi:type IV secretion system protein VirB10